MQEQTHDMKRTAAMDWFCQGPGVWVFPSIRLTLWVSAEVSWCLPHCRWSAAAEALLLVLMSPPTKIWGVNHKVLQKCTKVPPVLMFILTDTKSSAVNQTLAKVFLPCDYCGFCPSESSWLQREEEPQKIHGRALKRLSLEGFGCLSDEFLFHLKICLRQAKQSNYVCLVQTLQIYANFRYVIWTKDSSRASPFDISWFTREISWRLPAGRWGAIGGLSKMDFFMFILVQ